MRSSRTRDARHRQKGAPLADTIFVIFLAKDAFASCARRAAVVEKREKRGNSMKSIKSHEKSKRRRDRREMRRKFSQVEKGARGRSTRAREKETEGGFVTLAGIRVRASRPHAPTRGSVPRHTERAYALASLVPFKNSRSYRVFVLLYHSPPLPPPVRRAASRRAARIPDLEGCNKL